MIFLQESHRLFIFGNPTLVLCHIVIHSCLVCRNDVAALTTANLLKNSSLPALMTKITHSVRFFFKNEHEVNFLTHSLTRFHPVLTASLVKKATAPSTSQQGLLCSPMQRLRRYLSSIMIRRIEGKIQIRKQRKS